MNITDFPKDSGIILTVVLMNYRRPENVPALIDNIRSQSIRSRIFLWDNGNLPDGLTVDLKVHSSLNCFCSPRWILASMSSTPYTLIMDDDYLLNDSQIFEDVVGICSNNPNSLVGWVGWKHRQMRYSKGYWYDADTIREDAHVECAFGQFIAMRTNLLNKVPIRHPALNDLYPLQRGDDLVVSFSIGEGKPIHIIPKILAGRRVGVGNTDPKTALYLQPDNYIHRNAVAARLLEFYQCTPVQ